MLITVLKGRLLMWVYPLWSAYNVFTSKDVCIHSKGNMTAEWWFPKKRICGFRFPDRRDMEAGLFSRIISI